MNFKFKKIIFYAVILLAGIFAPIVFPAYTFQFAVLWLMILFALTWDILGGQMGYNSLGNILFFGAGMYICTVVQIGMYYDVAEYTAHFGAVKIDFTPYQYFTGIAAGLVLAGIVCLGLAVVFGWIVFGLRGPYFAIGTLGGAIAAGGTDEVEHATPRATRPHAPMRSNPSGKRSRRTSASDYQRHSSTS